VKISSLAEELGIPNNMLTGIYFVCVENVNTIWQQLTNPYQNQIEEEPQLPPAVTPAIPRDPASPLEMPK